VKNEIIISADTVIGVDEIDWQFSRSSGPGGQNVNKVETRVTLIFNIDKSRYLSEFQKNLLNEKLPGIIDHDGNLRISVDEERSQLRNRNIALDRFRERLQIAFRPIRKRKKTKVSKAQKEKRLKRKKIRSKKIEERKKGRNPADIDE